MTHSRKLLCIILAAGQGTRMKSTLPKVLHRVAGDPMIAHVIRAARSLNPDRIIVVIGPDHGAVADAVAPCDTVIQHDRLGTGHAVKTALAGQDITDTDVLVLLGDVPLVTPEILAELQERHRGLDQPAITVVGMEPADPTGYGRLITRNREYVERIVEDKDASDEEKSYRFCNTGVMMLAPEGLQDALAALKNNNAKGEYYLTDLIEHAHTRGEKCAYIVAPFDDMAGVNDRVQLATAEGRMQKRLRDRAMRAGVTMIDPASVYLSSDTVFGQDITIEPGVVIGPGVVIENGVTIKAYCHLEQVTLRTGARVGPFARLRDHSDIGTNVQIGNFVEVKKSIIGTGTKANHLTYLCDLDVGEHINIGVGALFSNYDGKNKYRSKIGDRSFVGANSTVISPVIIGEDSYVAAGSTITDDVPKGQLAFGRARQINRDHTAKTIQFSQKGKTN